ncbi:MAG: carbon-nitrogen hydrolase family protein [Gammaproteobacteria bacterium]|nr:carbon-nitrogen hydrolase family protein [Gammaproteobacteria bacterium]
MFKAAAIQMASGPNVEANLHETGRLIKQAAKAGASLVVLPENFAIMGLREQDKVAVREPQGEGVIQNFLAQQSRLHKIWIVGGTVPIECPDPRKIYAACLVYDDQGACVARYDKIHLFDVNLVDADESYIESETIEFGETGVRVVDSPFGKIGLAVCYDLRFPELFRNMLDTGVQITVLPAAFTAVTGQAHWESLIRARAIENVMYVIASAQGGYHINGRATYGDSMIVDPWGRVLDRVRHGAGMALGKIDLDYLESLRKTFPCIHHRRLK